MKRNKTRLTRKQLNTMYNYTKDLATKGSSKQQNLKFFFHPYTPNNIYVKYTTYSLEPDNSIMSTTNTICIMLNGEKRNCDFDFDTLQQKVQFESDFIEVDLDANANLIFV